MSHSNWIQGIRVYNGSDSQIAGNWIGIGVDGIGKLPNGNEGILVDGGSGKTVIGSGVATLVPEAARNVVSGNGKFGIAVYESQLTRISSNFVGIASDGLTAVPNAIDGILVTGSFFTLIGTDGDGKSDLFEGNVISGNTKNGIWLSNADYSRVAGNLIGLSADGTRAVANNHSNIQTATKFQETISVPMRLDWHRFQIVGNWIGPVGDGLHSLGNSEGGISIFEASNNKIGDGTAETSNSIIGNGRVGIQVSHLLSTGNSFSRNAIANHSVIEIDLGGDGPTPPIYIDTDNDQTVSPLDVLLVINFLNNRVSVVGEGESEAISFAVDWSTTESIGTMGRHLRVRTARQIPPG